MGSIADQLIASGWCQGHYVDDDGSVCIRTAVARSGLDLYSDRVHAALVVACGEDPNNILPGLAFNDAPERTYDEVLRAAKTADEILDAQ